jgi:hypothetical protein
VLLARLSQGDVGVLAKRGGLAGAVLQAEIVPPEHGAVGLDQEIKALAIGVLFGLGFRLDGTKEGIFEFHRGTVLFFPS